MPRPLIYRLLDWWTRRVARLVPEAERDAWLTEWDGELWYGVAAGRGGARLKAVVGLAWGMLRDALEVRRHRADHPSRTRLHSRGEPDGQRRSLAFVSVAARLGWRSVVRSPRMSATIVLTLAVGIGANVALFSVLKGVLLKPLPYPDPDRLVSLWEVNPDVEGDLHGPSPLNFVDWERDARTFESMTAWYLTSGTYRTEAWVEEIRSAQVTADFFRVLGVQPLLGRDFRREEVTRYGPVMLSHRIWQRRFGGDPAVVGSTIVSSASTYEIVGVMPPGFTFPDESVETWVAWDLPAVYADRPETRTWRFLRGLGRTAPGVSPTDAAADMRGVASALAESHADANEGWSVALTSLHDDLVGGVRGTLWFAFGAVVFVLVIACVNVANLLLARLPQRRREVAIRAALGEDRRTALAGLVGEGVVLAGTAALLGLLIGVGLLALLVAFDAGGIPRLDEVRLDGWVMLFTILVAALTALLFGVAPAFRSSDGETGTSLRHGGRTTATRRQRRLREAFVAGQVAVAMVLLAGAALFLSSLRSVRAVDPGFESDNVMTFRISLDPAADNETWTYYSTLVDRIEDVPGVVRAGMAQTLPINPVGNDFRRPYRPLGSAIESADAPLVQMRIVDGGYREAIGMDLRAGADLPESAEPGHPLVALVNETLAERVWPGLVPVGRTLEIDFRDGWQAYQVVGVVGDVRHYGPREGVRPEVFVSARQAPYLAMSVVARTSVSPESLTDALRATVASHVPLQPAHNFVTMRALRADSVAEERFLVVVFGVFACIALVLATSGVYGVIAYVVSHQRREMGVKMALGADGGRLVRGVVRHAGALAGAGLVLGLAVVLGLSRVVEDLLFGVEASSPATLAAVAGVILATATVAAYVPARRAGQVLPVEALRFDD